MSKTPNKGRAGKRIAETTPPFHLDPSIYVVAKKPGLTLFSHSNLHLLMKLPLPGIVIFVHGVNSDGEWYEATEKGLCAGLNERLKRRTEDMALPTNQSGQLLPAMYLDEYTPDGFINPDLNPKTFINPDIAYSPVIRFRWGYKASAEELQEYGSGVYLNERDYWGGGPFANGCTALPDLWGPGLDTSLLGPLKVEGINSTNNRQVYNCPPRPYFVLAALRLAKLIHALRREQADLPITLVCHSQGNMIGMAATFLGEALYKDAGVADTYVLCNSPYSLLKANTVESYSQSNMRDPGGGYGRQTGEARLKTLANFFDIARSRASRQQNSKKVNDYSSNEIAGYTADKDRAAHGYHGSIYGRVTLYCNPHDQVISSESVQGIGWRGLCNAEILATRGDGVFAQRVFAEGFQVGAGDRIVYRYWSDQYNKPKNSDEFWFPKSPVAEYSVAKSIDANKTKAGKAGAVVLVPVFKLIRTGNIHFSAVPPDDWTIPLEARPLPKPFPPMATGATTEAGFDEATDPPRAQLTAEAALPAGDPYGGAPADATDVPRGTVQTEAALRYDNHAYLRMRARREGLYKSGAKVVYEDEPTSATAKYKDWRARTIRDYLAANVNANATDHSTILTNPMHSQMALAYDVAVGYCTIPAERLHELRQAADWRLLESLPRGDLQKPFFEYFKNGSFIGLTPYDWANAKGSEGSMPTKIADQRDSREQQKSDGA
jgi:pimeloyl-ACP methyl ester carboxylesterase